MDKKNELILDFKFKVAALIFLTVQDVFCVKGYIPPKKYPLKHFSIKLFFLSLHRNSRKEYPFQSLEEVGNLPKPFRLGL